MKRLFLIIPIVLIIIASGCKQTQTPENTTEEKKPTEIEFKKTEHDFGSVNFAGNAECEFIFKNTGKNPLVLSNVSSSCGCTVPEWPREPISPGDTSSIKVKYNTRRTGEFKKSITIYSNTSTSPLKLFIKGVVSPKPMEDSGK
jgi:hypothetical protein